MTTPLQSYKKLLNDGSWKHDLDQENLAKIFDALYREVIDFQKSKRKLINKIFGINRTNVPSGIYIHGSVGRGKSVLMDLFSNSTGIKNVRRVHFHAFMQETHALIREQREQSKIGDPIIYVAKTIFSETKILCFDEFQVNDAADAMIIQRLFAKLFELGLVVVSTSNQPPDDLYLGGINRDLFLPFIKLLKTKCKIFKIDGEKDYRLEKLVKNKVYFHPHNEVNKKQFYSTFQKISGSEKTEKLRLNVQKRELEIEKYSNGIAMMKFDELCNKPLGTKDYLTISKRFKTFFIDSIPIMNNENRNQVKRFINLIDVLYDNNIKVVFLASETPENLYEGSYYKPEYERTSSRIYEMQSEYYLMKK